MSRAYDLLQAEILGLLRFTPLMSRDELFLRLENDSQFDLSTHDLDTVLTDMDDEELIFFNGERVEIREDLA